MTAEQEQAIRKDERAKVVEKILDLIRGHNIESVGGWDCGSDDEKKVVPLERGEEISERNQMWIDFIKDKMA